MTYTSTATNELAKYGKAVDYKLELRTNFGGSSAWLEYSFADFTLTQEAGSPATLRAELTNDQLKFSAEDNPAVRTQLFAEAQLSCTVAGETEVLFAGRIFRCEPRDYSFVIHAQDWLALVHDCECEVDLVPDETAEISTARQVSLIGGGSFGNTFGFTYAGGGDIAFNQDSDPGTRRRAWAAGNIRLWYDSSATDEVPPQHYQVNLTSGTFTILEDTSGNTYYATGVRCYEEGTLDWADVFKAALQYAKADGGIGAAAGELDIPDTGLDLAGPLYYRGKVGELLRRIERSQQANMRLWYDSRAGKYKLRIIEQAAGGNEDWELAHAQSIAQPRSLRDVYSRIVITGQTERPRNALTESATSITDITSQGDWFGWDGLNVGADSSFAAVSPLLYDGDANLGASVHNLAATEGGGSDQYDSWYSFVKIDLGSLQRVSRIRLVTPGSSNINAAAGHQGLFWPGIQILGSKDDSDYRLLARSLHGRYPPHELIEAAGEDILFPRLRYVKVLLGAYKHGIENQSDPSIGLAELELYTTEEYRVVKEIDGSASPASYYSYSADYDMDGSVDEWQRNHPELYTKLGERHRTYFEDQSGQLNELLAHDRATDLLAESVRLFQQVSYLAVCDPRIALYDTVAVDDELNGDIGSVLVEKIVLRPSGTEISGTNYLAGSLGA